MHSFEEINKKDEKTLDVFLYKIKIKLFIKGVNG